jgi:hypothetical protein
METKRNGVLLLNDVYDIATLLFYQKQHSFGESVLHRLI